MTLHTLLNTIGYCFLASTWIVHFATNAANEKFFRIKLLLSGIGMGVFISAIVVWVFQHFVK
jgi:hypothetical protein